ncbi:MAG: HAD hydrolase-like protein [Alphaproteobacteria bacterium]|nr:HAD hydrolase-like protein [Alphaproteobacteria bacterium]
MTDDIFALSAPMTLTSTLAIYESQRSHMPAVDMPAVAPGMGQRAPRLRDVLGEFDALLLDGYGVLNIGAEAVPEADNMLEQARAMGLAVLVLTNGASKPSSVTAAKYPALGLSIDPVQVVSSRDALLAALEGNPMGISCLGVADGFAEPPQGQGHEVIALNPEDDKGWARADAIGVFGAVQWTAAWQTRLEEALVQGKHVYVANPDVAAPQPGGYSREPGFWVAKAAQAMSVEARDRQIHWFGKPYAPVFDLARNRLEEITGRSNWKDDRIAMVGDSLHTDILGGQAAGLNTVLITGHGLFRQGGADDAISATGIMPDYIVDTV